MKKCIRRSVMWTSIAFSTIIVYCILSILYQFSYVDLVYLFIVIGYFVVYLKRVSEI